MQLLRANAEAQAFALQGMERERAMAEQLLQRERAMGEELKAMAEQLLQAKEELLQRERAMAEQLLQSQSQVSELRADIRIKDAVLQAQDAVHKSEVAVLESKLQSASAAPPPAPAPHCHCSPRHGSLGRYAADEKHVCHKGYIYASAHVHDVEWHLEDGHFPVDVDAGFEVAPGDAADVEVVNEYAWRCSHLVFSDGTAAETSLYDHWHDDGDGGSDADGWGKGVKYGSGWFKRDAEGRVSSKCADGDVLLRKRI